MKRFANTIPPYLLGTCLAALLPMSAMAASQCKGLTQTDCSGAEQCRWVDSYVRKDGREVDGYCRVLRSSKAATDHALKTGAAD
jgi:hypothetical protein